MICIIGVLIYNLYKMSINNENNINNTNDIKQETNIENDPTMVLSRENVRKAKADKSGRVYRIYSDGCFDMFHIGHMNMLKQVKYSLGDPSKVHLIAGVS